MPPSERAPADQTGPTPQAVRVAVVISRYNASVTDGLLRGADRAFEREAPDASSLDVFDAPGAFELPVCAGAAVATGRYDGVLTLGCVIKGETEHDLFINHAVATALADLGARTGVPVAFGVLTTRDADQALARAGGNKGNKGDEAMTALLQTIWTVRAIRAGRTPGVAGAPGARPDKAANAGRVGGRA